MSTFILNRLTFRAGARAGAAPLQLEPGIVTLLVGPNNSGKSRFLNELSAWAQGTGVQGLVLADAQATWPSDLDELKAALGAWVHPSSAPNHFRVIAPSVAGGGGGQDDIDAQPLATSLATDIQDLKRVQPGWVGLRRRFGLRYFTALWTGRERFSLAGDQPLADLQAPPTTHLQALFRNDALRARIRRLIYEAFGLYLVLDPTQPGQIRLRLSRTEPPNPSVERGLGEAAIAFHRETMPLQEQSDGIQCYVGMVTALYSVPLKLVLIDEPEAFLHPPLARRLGSTVADIARERGARVVAATHSAEFLRGCIESATSTSIVRLTYSRATSEATARSLSTSELRPLMSEPLLRSTRALEGLFHRAVIVGESDADRAFYDEINRRLVTLGRGVGEAQFVNAQNWSTEARVIAPLRRLGVPAAGILDLDTLWNPKSHWRSLYRAVGLGDADPVRLRLEEEQTKLARDQTERERCKVAGVGGLARQKRQPMRALIASLADYGIFVVPRGELEAWLPELEVSRSDKHAWIVQMLERLGADPSRPDYVQPGRGDVWRFIDSIERWVANPQRKGMPG